MVSAQKPWYGASHSHFVFIFHNWMGRERRAWKKENKINLTSFRLLSTCSVSSWMTMTRHPLTTIHIPLWINEYVSTLQNKRQVEELIQWNKSLHRQISHKALLLRYEIWQRWLSRMDTVAWSACDSLPFSVHCGRLVAPARVTCIINSASLWHCVLAAFFAYGRSRCQDKQRSESKREKNFRKKSNPLSHLLIHSLP